MPGKEAGRTQARAVEAVDALAIKSLCEVLRHGCTANTFFVFLSRSRLLGAMLMCEKLFSPRVCR